MVISVFKALTAVRSHISATNASYQGSHMMDGKLMNTHLEESPSRCQMRSDPSFGPALLPTPPLPLGVLPFSLYSLPSFFPPPFVPSCLSPFFLHFFSLTAERLVFHKY